MEDVTNGALSLWVDSIGPLEGEHELGEVRYGLNELRGENQEGKSHTLLAVRQLPVPRLRRGTVAITDGHDEGAVGLGEHSLRLVQDADRFSAKREGEGLAAVQEMPDPIDVLVGASTIKSPDARLKKRLRAFCELLRLSGNEERMKTMLRGVRLPHQNFERVSDLLDQAEVLAAPRGLLNTEGLETERQAKAMHTAAAEAQGVEKDLRKRLRELGLDPEDPNTVPRGMEEQMATDALVGLRSTLAAQQELAAQREVLAAPEPDVLSPEAAFANLVEDIHQKNTRRNELEQQLAELDAELATLRGRRTEAGKALHDAQERHRQWTNQQRELSEMDANPVSQEDIDAAQADVEKIRAQIAAGPMFDQMKEAHSSFLHSTEAAEELEELAKAYRDSVGTVWRNLGLIINEAVGDDSPIRVDQVETDDGVESRVTVQVADGSWWDVSDDARVSKGRLRQAFLELFLANTELRDVTVWVDDLIMLPIGPEGRQKIHEMAAERQIRLLFEQPAERGLRLHWWGEAS